MRAGCEAALVFLSLSPTLRTLEDVASNEDAALDMKELIIQPQMPGCIRTDRRRFICRLDLRPACRE
jgi:hypothetical protein